MLRRVDLHTHSNASDGTDTPSELIDKAHAAGLAAVAITDHDTLSGLSEAEREAQKYPDMEFVRGVEVSTGSDHGEMHILGLWVPRDAEPLEKALAEMRAKRGERNARIVEKLCRLGCPLSMDDVMKEAGGESVGRPHIAMALITKGYVKSMKEAFDKYLGQTGSAYLPKDVMDPEKAVSIMSYIGCSVVIAHPLLRSYPPAFADWKPGTASRQTTTHAFCSPSPGTITSVSQAAATTTDTTNHAFPWAQATAAFSSLKTPTFF